MSDINKQVARANLVGTVNAGYTITKVGDEAVIAHNPNKPDPWVAWHYSFDEETGNPSFYWGRYGSEATADEAFYKKEHGIYSGGSL